MDGLGSHERDSSCELGSPTYIPACLSAILLFGDKKKGSKEECASRRLCSCLVAIVFLLLQGQVVEPRSGCLRSRL